MYGLDLIVSSGGGATGRAGWMLARALAWIAVLAGSAPDFLNPASAGKGGARQGPLGSPECEKGSMSTIPQALV